MLPGMGFLSEVLACKADRGAHFKQAVMNPGMGGVLQVLQAVQRQIGGDDQRLAAAVSAVYHIESLFKPVFRPVLHAEVVNDKQRVRQKRSMYSLPKPALRSFYVMENFVI